MVYDVIIIGAGPAGLTAAIFSARRELKTLIIGKDLGGQVVWAGEIENYPGFKSISNFDFIDNFKNQALNSGAELKIDEVKLITKTSDEFFKITTNKEEFLSRTVIVAIGLFPRRLAVPGEVEFSGRGVSYCANCDGPLYKGKTVVVVGAGNAAFDAAELLSKIAKQVYLLSRDKKFKAFESLVAEVSHRDNVKIITDVKIKEIIGSKQVEKIIYTDESNNNLELNTEAVFIEVGRIAHTDLVLDFIDRDDKLQLVVNNNLETKTPGLFAAGDVTNLSEFKQISIATGQATIAALNAYKYLQTKDGKKTLKTYY